MDTQDIIERIQSDVATLAARNKCYPLRAKTRDEAEKMPLLELAEIVTWGECLMGVHDVVFMERLKRVMHTLEGWPVP